MIKSKKVYVYPNAPFFYDWELIGTEILGLKREGIGYTEVDSEPTGRSFSFDRTSGYAEFDSSIHDGTWPIGRFIPEVINVLFKV